MHGKPGAWTVVDPASARWSASFAVAGEPAGGTAPIVIADNRLCHWNADGAAADFTRIVCFDFATGAQNGAFPASATDRSTTCRTGVVITKQMGKDRWTDPGMVRAYTADRQGKLLWEYPLIEKWGKMTSGVFLNGLYWTFTKDFTKDDQPGGRYVGLDVKTGKSGKTKGRQKAARGATTTSPPTDTSWVPIWTWWTPA